MSSFHPNQGTLDYMTEFDLGKAYHALFSDEGPPLGKIVTFDDYDVFVKAPIVVLN